MLRPLVFSGTIKAAKWPEAVAWCGILRAGSHAEKGRRTMLDRRNFMKTCSGVGLAGTLFPGVLWAQAQSAGEKDHQRHDRERRVDR